MTREAGQASFNRVILARNAFALLKYEVQDEKRNLRLL